MVYKFNSGSRALAFKSALEDLDSLQHCPKCKTNCEKTFYDFKVNMAVINAASTCQNKEIFSSVVKGTMSTDRTDN